MVRFRSPPGLSWCCRVGAAALLLRSPPANPGLSPATRLQECLHRRTRSRPIHWELIPRSLAYGTQLTLPHETAWYVREDGTLDQEGLGAFEQLWGEVGPALLAARPYQEAAPHLVLLLGAGGGPLRSLASARALRP